MYRKMEDFTRDFKSLTESTSKIFAALSDKNTSQEIPGYNRTLGQVAWHIVTTVSEMMNRTGLGMSAVNAESMPPAAAAEILTAYQKTTFELSEKLTAWNDETLTRTDELYGETWQRGNTLAILIKHEVHHIGQMTVLLRQAGAVVPGIYGPAKEEWEKYGMPEPPY